MTQRLDGGELLVVFLHALVWEQDLHREADLLGVDKAIGVVEAQDVWGDRGTDRWLALAVHSCVPAPATGEDWLCFPFLCLPSRVKFPRRLFPSPWELPPLSKACKQTLTSCWPVSSLALVAQTGNQNNGHGIPLSSHLDACIMGAGGGPSEASWPLGFWAKPAHALCLPHGHPKKQGL